MRILIYSTRPHDQQTLVASLGQAGHTVTTTALRLEPATLGEAMGCEAVCTFVCDEVSAAVLQGLREQGVELLLQRAAGVDNIDLVAARSLGIAVARVPDYSPHAVAEHAVALLLSLNRHVHQAYQRMQRADFSLDTDAFLAAVAKEQPSLIWLASATSSIMASTTTIPSSSDGASTRSITPI